jgi:hypothetical protein
MSSGSKGPSIDTPKVSWDLNMDRFTMEDLTRRAENITKGAGDVAKNLVYSAGTGDFNNAGNAYLNQFATLATGGNAAENSIGTQETTIQRKARESGDKAAQDAAQAEADTIKAQEAARTKQVQDMISGIVDTYRKSPGRSQTMLTTGMNNNTLLTYRGGR